MEAGNMMNIETQPIALSQKAFANKFTNFNPSESSNRTDSSTEDSNEKSWGSFIEETAFEVKEACISYYGMKKSPRKAIIEILSKRIGKHVQFYFFKDSSEFVYFDEGWNAYRFQGDLKIRELCQSIMKRAGFEKEINNSAVAEVIGHITRSSYCEREEYEDSETSFIPLSNGILDIKTLELIPYDADHLFLFRLEVKYDKEAKCPRFEKFLDEICQDKNGNVDKIMRRSLIQLVAYSLWRGYPIQGMFFLIGPGANGKGVFLNTLQNLLGLENVATRSVIALSSNRFASADLHRKHANISNELTVSELRNVDLLKSLCSGTDLITSEQKFKPSFKFKSYAKLIIATNAPPITDDATDGFYRRLYLFMFQRQFLNKEADKGLSQKLSEPEELSGILNLALEELRLWIDEEGNFKPDADFANALDVSETRKIYDRASDSVSAFIYDELELTGLEEDWVSKNQLFARYRNYCLSKKIGPHTQDKFSKNFRAKTAGIVEDKRAGAEKIRGLKGIRFITGDEKNVSGYPTEQTKL